MIYTSSNSVSEVRRKSQSYLNSVSAWYQENRLKINGDKSKVMRVEFKFNLSLNIDEFIVNHDGTPLELVEHAKYLGMSINSEISCGFSCVTALPKYVLPFVFIKTIRWDKIRWDEIR